jgi:hypothetical protein
MENLVEKLKRCPIGYKLYSPILGDVKLSFVGGNYIRVARGNLLFKFDYLGRYMYQEESFSNDGECMLFPSKTDRDWSRYYFNTLPTSWKEYCESHPIQPEEAYFDTNSKIYDTTEIMNRNPDSDRNLLPNRSLAMAVRALIQLIHLRDCYNDGWTPDDQDAGWPIVVVDDKIIIRGIVAEQNVLTLKTKDLADEFLMNFRSLIETAKPLL